MKKLSGSAITGIVLGGIILILALWGVGSYNGLVGLREKVQSQSANIQTQLQRRLDLIPNLVNTVKAATTHEENIISEIAQARANLVNASNGSMQEKAAANDELSGAISRLLVIVEQYPNITANEQFHSLTDELAGTENRIAYARKDYNDSVQMYNNKTKTFPAMIFANMFGFSEEEYFLASSGSELQLNLIE